MGLGIAFNKVSSIRTWTGIDYGLGPWFLSEMFEAKHNIASSSFKPTTPNTTIIMHNKWGSNDTIDQYRDKFVKTDTVYMMNGLIAIDEKKRDTLVQLM